MLFCVKQKTAYELRISDWSSDVCSSDLTRVTFLAPARGLIGYHGEFLTDTRGTGIMHRLFHSYGPHKGPIQGRRNGVLISNGTGKAVPYALCNLEERGEIFLEPGSPVYEGMVIGEHRSEEHPSELQSLMRISYAVFRLEKKK